MQTYVQNLSTKGQIVIPSRLRNYLNMKPQNKILIRLSADEKKITLEAMPDPIVYLRGILKKTTKTALQIKKELRTEEELYEIRKKNLRS